MSARWHGLHGARGPGFKIGDNSALHSHSHRGQQSCELHTEPRVICERQNQEGISARQSQHPHVRGKSPPSVYASLDGCGNGRMAKKQHTCNYSSAPTLNGTVRRLLLRSGRDSKLGSWGRPKTRPFFVSPMLSAHFAEHLASQVVLGMWLQCQLLWIGNGWASNS